MPAWESEPPEVFSIVTGFFPEASPKETWATNPRPLLVCGLFEDEGAGIFFCRVAYGTSRIEPHHRDDLVIGNLSILDQLRLKKPTRFVIHSGREMAILPWTQEFFRACLPGSDSSVS